MATPWSYFDNFEKITDEYLPATGEGDTKATQAVTAACKIIYKWFNDGDVFDNQYGMEGFGNDLSSYANWLYKYCPDTQSILARIYDCYTEGEYTDILADLADSVLDIYYLDELSQMPKAGSIYDCDGPFAFVETDDDEYDDDYDEEYDDEEYDDEEYY